MVLMNRMHKTALGFRQTGSTFLFSTLLNLTCNTHLATLLIDLDSTFRLFSGDSSNIEFAGSSHPSSYNKGVFDYVE